MVLVQQKQGIERILSPGGETSLEFCPGAGGCITAFRHERNGKTLDLFRPYDRNLPLSPLNAASFPLTPYSNRIINGRLTVGEKTYSVGPRHASEPHQLHGDGWLRPWTLAELDPHRAVLTLQTEKSAQTPYIYRAKQVLALDDGQLDIGMEITNMSGFALPFGLGHHPYFIRDADTVLKANLPKVWTSRQIVPESLIDTPSSWDFSSGLALSDAHFGPPSQGVEGRDMMDHCFQGWDQRAEISWPQSGLKLIMTADPIFANFVIYIPAQKPFFCAEPVTNIIDGFNLREKGIPDTGTIMLGDGETLKGSMRFEAADL
jgi:aldose 1-epimerase